MVRCFCVAIPLVGQKRHSLGAGTFNHAAATSGVKVAQHPKGLTLTLAPGGWPAPESEDTEFGVLMEPEVRHGEAKVYTRVQA
jgi:hypothetical protein